MENNLFIQLLLKLKILNPNKKIAKQLRRPHGKLANYVGEQMNLGNRDLYEFMLKNIDIKNGERVLEIGYGNGHFYKEIFEKSPDAEISGIDLSQIMHKEAVITNKELIEAGKLDLHHGTSDRIPYQDNIFDKVFCLNVVYFWDKPEDHLKEILRVLKPGGTFYSGNRTKETMKQMPFSPYGFSMYDPEDWQAMLNNNNFNNTDFLRHTETVEDFNGKESHYYSACVWGKK